MIEIRETIPEIVARTGVTHPNVPPFADISFVGVAWNEEERAEALLELARTWFSSVVIAVQESTDGTLDIVRRLVNRPEDQILEHPHHGYGDASMPDLIHAVKTRWAFVVAFDEWPSTELLTSLQSATAYAEGSGIDAYWIRFESITEGIQSSDTQAGHLRLFESRLEWPRTMHSRPAGRSEATWPFGHITHERSLDEMIRDYLRYYELGKGKSSWEAHNKLMMHDACVVIADHLGWEYVMHHAWWPEVKALAFSEEELARGD